MWKGFVMSIFLVHGEFLVIVTLQFHGKDFVMLTLPFHAKGPYHYGGQPMDHTIMVGGGLTDSESYMCPSRGQNIDLE